MKKIYEFIFNSHLSLFFGFSFIILISGVFLYFKSGGTVQKSLDEQILHRQQIIVRAGAQSIESYFNSIGNNLSLYSTRPDILSKDSNTQLAMNLFVTRWSLPLSGMILTDANGKILYNANREMVIDRGKSVSDRKYFTWAKDSKYGDVFIGMPVISRSGASNGKSVMPIAVPLLKNNRFEGVLTIAVYTDDLIDKYLDPLKITSESVVELKEEKILNEIKQIENGFLISRSPLKLGNNNFSLSIKTPLDHIKFYTWPLYKEQAEAFLMLVFVIICYGLIEVRNAHKNKDNR